MDHPTTSVVTFLSPISPPAKIPYNPASPDETPASPLQPTNNPTTTVSDVASPPPPPPQLDYSSQFRSVKTINLNLQTDFLRLVPSYLTFDPYSRAPIVSNFSQTSLLLDANIAVNTIQITHAEHNDPASVSNTNSTHWKYSFGIADAKNTQFKAHLSLLNDWKFLQKRSLLSPVDVAKPSGASLPHSISIFL